MKTKDLVKKKTHFNNFAEESRKGLPMVYINV